jgi:hypothetical protein
VDNLWITPQQIIETYEQKPGLCGINRINPQANKLSTVFSTELLTTFTLVVISEYKGTGWLSTVSTGVIKKII